MSSNHAFSTLFFSNPGLDFEENVFHNVHVGTWGEEESIILDGLSEQNINNITEYNYIIKNNGETEKCVICLEDFVENEKIKILLCLHKFHSQCINQWLGLKNFCPLCKTKVV